MHLFFLLLITSLLSIGCIKSHNIPHDSTETYPLPQQSDSSYFHPQYFHQLREYIRKNGESEILNASSRADKPMTIEYHRLSFEDIAMSVDYSNRIYFSRAESMEKIGNILLTDDHTLEIEAETEQSKRVIFVAFNTLLQNL